MYIKIEISDKNPLKLRLYSSTLSTCSEINIFFSL